MYGSYAPSGSMDGLWEWIVSDLLKASRRSSRAGNTYELTGFSATLTSVDRAWLFNRGRKLSPSYGAAEFLWYLSGCDDAELVTAYAPGYRRFLDDGVHAYGAYGRRWKETDQIRRVYHMLKHSPDSRQAIMTCWRPGDLAVAKDGTSKDIPCTLTLQFLLRDDHLQLITTMRSNDVWLGFPYDLWCFTRLQKIMAEMLDVEVGNYTHQVGSMHLYEADSEKASAALSDESRCFTSLHRGTGQRARVKCPDTLDAVVGQALHVEKSLRTNATNNAEIIDNILGVGTLFAELVACCIAKSRPDLPPRPWLAPNLLP